MASSTENHDLSDRLELTCVRRKYFKKATHTWTIDDFLGRLEIAEETEEETQEDTIKSDTFFIPIKTGKGKERRLRFELSLVLKSSQKENHSHISWYVHGLNTDPPYRMKFEVCIKRPDLSKGAVKIPIFCLDRPLKCQKTFSSDLTNWGWPQAFDKNVLKQNPANALDNGALTLITRLEVECQQNQEGQIIPKTLVQGYLGKRLWNSKDKTGDIVMICGDSGYSAHKNVLMASSDVLEAMFHHQTAENQTGMVYIRDMSPRCLEEFLHYIYLNRLNPDVKSVEDIEGLLIAAEKYNVIDLKTRCEQELSTLLNDSNVGRIGVIANMHNAAHLRDYVVNYVTNNYQDLVGNSDDQWDILPTDIMKEALKATSC